MPTVSIVIPHYGDPAPTLALVHALRAQLRSGDELIVSDDHSPDPFPAADGITVVRRPQNGGFGANCNTGAAAATGDYLLFLNSDLEISDDFLEKLRRAATPFQPCVAGPRIVRPDGRVDHTARHFPTAAHQISEWLVPLARFRETRVMHEMVGHDTRTVTAPEPSPTGWLVGAVLLIPRAEFEAVGGFDERFFMNAEEVDLQRRLRDRGIPAIYLPSVEVVHEGGGASDSSKRRTWLVEGRWRYAEKWGGVAPLKAGLTAATAINLVWNSGRRILGRDVDPWGTARQEAALVWRRHRD